VVLVLMWAKKLDGVLEVVLEVELADRLVTG